MGVWVRWGLAGALAALIAAPPFIMYRADYVTSKRLREVAPGRFYRSGQMTAGGLEDAIRRYKIKMVVNLQHENPDPGLHDSWVGNWFGGKQEAESEVCRRLNVRYALITPDILPKPNDLSVQPPGVTDFLRLMDDDTAYPVLIHCKAGLHRTGRLTAVYRMEYEGWGVGEAMRELRANGYGYGMASEADEFIIQFVQNYKPRPRARVARGQGPAAGGRP